MASMRSMTGTCKYCKQYKVVQVPKGKEYTQEEVNNIATAECDCEGAEEEAKIQSRIKGAMESIDRILIKKDKKIIAPVMQSAVELMARERIKKLSINIDGESTCSMYIKGSKIVVESRRTEVECSDGTVTE